MRFFLRVLCIAGLFLSSCDDQATQPAADIPAPVLLPSPNEIAIDERGLDAVPEGDGIQIQWLPDDRLYQVRLYRRQADEDEFRSIAAINASDTVYIDYSALVDQRYYYTARGLDEQGQTGPASDTLDYRLLPKAVNLGVTFSDSMYFYWQLLGFLPDRYVLKLYDDEKDDVVWFSEIQSAYSGLEERVRYNWDQKALLQNLEQQKRYRWRVDIIGPSLNSGSESNWHRFVVP